ncbi:MAG: NAD(P)/FAD-dependent oxidoreductase [Solirubrobacterales bacterium]|nr:NAD(P)/FAD-dependent oxidoreductase [Solirubrobacterales bacterium]OJU93372.1 MAG: FAD-dependent oxidoreductase [Solirubrobacterales bacterium 67-14]
MERTELLVIGAGQSGLAAAHTARQRGIETLLLDASESTAGSWPRYYESLKLFSPARYSGLPGLEMDGDPDRYPSRDEVIAYLESYGQQFSDDLRMGERVESVERHPEGGFLTNTEAGSVYWSRSVIAATGHFERPFQPDLRGLEGFGGQVIHSAEYISPEPFAGSRVVVVGAGNSAIQIAADLAPESEVILATRSKIKWMSQRPLGRDIHWWLTLTRFDTAKVSWLLNRLPVSVIDDGLYRSAIERGEFARRPMFDRIDGHELVWSDGSREHADHLILATGYRPNLAYLNHLGALTTDGTPSHGGGVSTVVPGLGFVGLEFQRSFSSNTLRGCGRDAAHVVDRLRSIAPATSEPGLVTA